MMGWDGRWLCPGCVPGMFLQKWFFQKIRHQVCQVTRHCFVKHRRLTWSFPRHSWRCWRKRHEQADDRWGNTPLWSKEESVSEWSLLFLFSYEDKTWDSWKKKKEERWCATEEGKKIAGLVLVIQGFTVEQYYARSNDSNMQHRLNLNGTVFSI